MNKQTKKAQQQQQSWKKRKVCNTQRTHLQHLQTQMYFLCSRIREFFGFVFLFEHLRLGESPKRRQSSRWSCWFSCNGRNGQLRPFYCNTFGLINLCISIFSQRQKFGTNYRNFIFGFKFAGQMRFFLATCCETIKEVTHEFQISYEKNNFYLVYRKLNFLLGL